MLFKVDISRFQFQSVEDRQGHHRGASTLKKNSELSNKIFSITELLLNGEYLPSFLLSLRFLIISPKT